MTEIRELLISMSDNSLGNFQSSLCPTVKREAMLGIPTARLRALAKEMIKDGRAEVFITRLPHKYFEENQLHAFIIAEERDFGRLEQKLDSFLPYIDNWATCDQLLPRAFSKNHSSLIEKIKKWLKSPDAYTRRFAIGALMKHFLGEDFKSEYISWVAESACDEYYVNMMIAWYFTEAIVKQYSHTIVYIKEKKLPKWIHNKTIQKVKESFRVPPKVKELLSSLRL